MRFLIAILILTSISLRAQTCDSLKNEEVTYDVPIATLENLSESNCDKAKLYLAYELLHGYHIEKDTVRAIGLLIECKDHDIDCNYELCKLNSHPS